MASHGVPHNVGKPLPPSASCCPSVHAVHDTPSLRGGDASESKASRYPVARAPRDDYQLRIAARVRAPRPRLRSCARRAVLPVFGRLLAVGGRPTIADCPRLLRRAGDNRDDAQLLAADVLLFPGVSTETAARPRPLRLTQARIGDTLHDGNGTRVAIVNAFTTVNPETEGTVRVVDYQVLGAASEQFGMYSDDEGDVARWRRGEPPESPGRRMSWMRCTPAETGGRNGGTIVAEGTTETVAAHYVTSHTWALSDGTARRIPWSNPRQCRSWRQRRAQAGAEL